MRFISLAIGSLIVVTPCLSFAQQSAQPSQPATEMQTLINALSGHWSLKFKFEPSSENPAGLEGSGEERWHAGPQGLTFTDEEVLTIGSQSSVVVGLLWQDPKTKEFHALDCSTEISNTCDVKAAAENVVHWTGSELTVDEKELSHGQTMTSRVTWSDITANSFTESGYLAPAGGEFKKVMTIHATRTADGRSTITH